MKRITVCVAFAVQAFFALHAAAEERIINVGSARLELREGDWMTGVAQDESFVVQFEATPDALQRDDLRRRGLTLDAYLGSRAYVARCESPCFSWLPGERFVRATANLSPDMKRSPVFDTDAGLAGRIRDGLPLALDLTFVEGISFERAAEILQEDAIEISQVSFGSRSSINIETTWKKALDLLERAEVRWLEPAVPELIPSTANACERMKVNQVREQSEFLFADGAGTKVGVWDWFPEDSHPDLEERVTWVNVIRGQSRHGQLVSGVIAGAGLGDDRARGVAPKADLYWHTVDRSTIWNDQRATRARHGITITQNAWGIPVGWWTDPSEPLPLWENNAWALGYYHQLAAGADDLVRSDDLLVVVGIGNLRGFGPLGRHLHSGPSGDDKIHEDVHTANPEYGFNSGAMVAKNVLTVGWVTKDEVITPGSGRGPTKDGRIKPEVVAPGLDLLVTDENDGYTVASGGSLAGPAVAGAAALLTDYWTRRHGVSPTSLELKNLLIHSARDLGRPGPDFEYGFGLIDVEFAARVLDAAPFPTEANASGVPAEPRRRGARRPIGGNPVPSSRLVSGEVDQGQDASFPFVVPRGTSSLRATLAWHDPEGSQLVNDLDLTLVAPDGTVVSPFVLDAANPAAPASRGRNRIDNVELVTVELPATGVWTVVVEGSRIAMAPQRYSLTVSTAIDNEPLHVLPEGRCEIFDFYLTKSDGTTAPVVPSTRFVPGDPLNIFVSAGVPENSDYGDYYGSIFVLGKVVNAQGEVIGSSLGNTHLQAPVEMVEGVGQAFVIPAGMPKAAYDAVYSVRLANGTECSASVGFVVE